MNFEFMRLLGDVFLENLGLGGLGISKVHHLVKQLVDDNKIVADGFFFDDFEVLGKDLNNFM